MKLLKKIRSTGVENCLFLVPMRPRRRVLFISYTTSSDAEVVVPAKITEVRDKISDNYKLELVSQLPGFGSERFYVSDLESMIKEGRIDFFTKVTLS